MDLTVVIAARNRPEDLVRAVRSVLDQEARGFRFVVSDNSSNSSVQEALQAAGLLPSIEYRRRVPDVASLAHFQTILSEIDTRYFVIFHDDDRMAPSFVGRLYAEVSTGQYSAVACNAYIWTEGRTRGTKISTRRDQVFVEPRDFVLSFLKNSLAPYPAYMYDRSKLQGLNFGNRVGKYSDVVWLLDVLARGPIKWLGQPHMDYTVGPNQDSAQFDYAAQQKLNQIYGRCLGSQRHPKLVHVRLDFLYSAMGRSNARTGKGATLRQLGFFLARLRFDLAAKLVAKSVLGRRSAARA